nr:MAG TPA_asm: hypothetical protein [Caudoviricetes sp.]
MFFLAIVINGQLFICPSGVAPFSSARQFVPSLAYVFTLV